MSQVKSAILSISYRTTQLGFMIATTTGAILLFTKICRCRI